MKTMFTLIELLVAKPVEAKSSFTARAKTRANSIMFTLIELLVVIAIIALLAGMLFPVINKAKQTSKWTDCQNNLRGIGQALRMYLNESEDIMPVAAQMPSVDTFGLPRICDILSPHIDNIEAFRCPSDNKNYYENEGSSYEYKMNLGGRLVKDLLKGHLGSNTFIMYDYEPFHGKAGTAGATNYLFIDGRVSDLKD